MSIRSDWKSGIKECWEWLAINLLLPALIPIFFAFMCAFIRFFRYNDDVKFISGL
jgi:hypothetical protein